MYCKMNSQRITKNYYPPVHDNIKRGYLVRVAEELEAEQEIKEYDGAEDIHPSERDGERYTEV